MGSLISGVKEEGEGGGDVLLGLGCIIDKQCVQRKGVGKNDVSRPLSLGSGASQAARAP
jgi:hypothetical protein